MTSYEIENKLNVGDRVRHYYNTNTYGMGIVENVVVDHTGDGYCYTVRFDKLWIGKVDTYNRWHLIKIKKDF